MEERVALQGPNRTRMGRRLRRKPFWAQSSFPGFLEHWTRSRVHDIGTRSVCTPATGFSWITSAKKTGSFRTRAWM